MTDYETDERAVINLITELMAIHKKYPNDYDLGTKARRLLTEFEKK